MKKYRKTIEIWSAMQNKGMKAPNLEQLEKEINMKKN